MTRVILFIGLLAVGYDAYAYQGAYTRSLVDRTVEGVNKMASSVTTATQSPVAAPRQPG